MAMLMAGCASSPEARPTEPISKVDAGTTAPSPQPSSTLEGPFGQVGGWIAYTGDDGIWAVDPAHPERRIRLGRADGHPIAWSSDGSKLLIRRESPNQLPDGCEGAQCGIPETDLFVLHADGTETRLTQSDAWTTGGSFSPDGSEVVYPNLTQDGGSGIYVVSSEGGKPKLLHPGNRGGDSVYSPTFSPDGTQVAYFEGGGDHSHNLWVMNADGTEGRLLLDEGNPVLASGHMRALTWSPDSEWLAFATDGRIYLVRPDGTGLRPVVHQDFGVEPAVQWSPDGSRIAYLRVGETCFLPAGGREPEDLTCEPGALHIVNLDGGDERLIEGIRTPPESGSIAWNPAV